MSDPKSLTRRSAMMLTAGALAAPVLIRPTIVNAAELDQAIGQLIMIGFTGRSANGKFVKSIASHIAKGRAASVVYLGRNIGSSRDVAGLNRLFHNAGVRHIAIDHEGGVVQRLRQKHGFTRLPSALKVAQSRSVASAEKLYGTAAKELSRAGFTFNLGPVVDLHRDYNPVIGKNRRAYSADPNTVAAYAGAFIRAHRRHGMTTSIKHFPGHGLSRSDSHHGFVDIRETWDPQELKPFSLLIRQGLADAVMSGHLFVRVGQRGNGELTTFSRALIKDVLRGGLGFEGLAMTDDLDMGAVRKTAPPQEATIRAVEAGYDMLLMSNTAMANDDMPAIAVNWIRSAVREGRIQEGGILSSAARVRASRRV
ncbi:beta-N-acetylhexosaminidase [Cohaesibacter sp. ES.047]|uniref:glycoside hydrolase family 3 protein n=1 Tax=Cohaesibacter sp. ES.047 TaxID=1798205 RepID=UPI000BBF4E8F|nr:glycoside hydrolase family 3 N-terminal domain-containing protein [Cohaesibacter sp. ES.047]SNY92092.1 beta-N-acetylhexosaminidase [Cohaesibacter sp. ES.047]